MPVANEAIDLTHGGVAVARRSAGGGERTSISFFPVDEL